MRLLRPLMGMMRRMMPTDPSGENPRAVRMAHRMSTLHDAMTGRAFRRAAQQMSGSHAWPVTSGTYVVGDAAAPVAVCTLTSNELMQPLAVIPGVAIAGRVYTPNLGIEKIILNVTANPAIRFLLLCGKESPVFHPAQALRALLHDGVTPERRIVGAEGHLPVLSNVAAERIEAFRRQVELVDSTGETDTAVLAAQVRELAAHTPSAFAPPPESAAALSVLEASDARADAMSDRRFVAIRPGGVRQPLAYDSRGFFVVTLDRTAGEIVCRHYLPDNPPAHEMRGHSTEAMLLGLIREDLITQLSHAGYLGGELAKAEAALRLSLRYEQDQPLRREAS